MIIIGACSKIGTEYVKLLSKKENELILIDTDKENLINIQNKYKGKVNMQIIATDISLESKIKEIYIFIRKEKPEFIINNLSFYNNDKFFDNDTKETNYEYQLNCLYLFSKLFLRDMIKNNNGVILNTISVDFYNRNLLNADYLGLEMYLKELTRYVNQTIKKEKLNIRFLLAFLLVSCNQIKKEVKNKPKEQENIKKEDILNTEVNEEINPNLDSEITTE